MLRLPLLLPARIANDATSHVLSFLAADPARWDTWARLFQPLLSKVPLLSLTG